MDAQDSSELRRAEARAEAAELELERAQHLLDLYGVPREFRQPGERDPIEYSLEARLRLVLEDEDDPPSGQAPSSR